MLKGILKKNACFCSLKEKIKTVKLLFSWNIVKQLMLMELF